MLKKHLIKVIALSVLVITVIAVKPAKVYAAWEKGDTSNDANVTDWRYNDGTAYVQNGWKSIGGKWYFFQNGYMNIGWVHESGNNDVYYCDTETGELLTGWKRINEFWYYFYSDGKRASDTQINGYKLSKSGMWIETTATSKKIKGKWQIGKSDTYITITDTTYSGEPYIIIKDEGSTCTIERSGDGYSEVYSIKVKNDNAITTSLFNQYRGYYTAPYSCTRVE